MLSSSLNFKLATNHIILIPTHQLAAPIRYLLEYVDQPYEEKHYKFGPAPKFDKEEWFKEKFNLGLDFPNLPYYIDGDIKMSQSKVILRHLGRKHKLDGKTEADKVRVDLALDQTNDYFMQFVQLVYNADYENLKAEYLNNLPDKLKALSNFLGNHKFVAGDYVTFADFTLLEFLESQVAFSDDVLKNFPTLEAYHKRVLSLPGVEKYFKSDRFIKYPFFSPFANFNGKK